MKNLMVYTNPQKKFNEENATLVKIHIDNSYDLGWKKEDLVIMTNFPFEYNGIKTTVVDDVWCDFDMVSNKIPVISNMLKYTIGEYFWYHDFDCYQAEKIDLEITHDLGLTDYGWSPKWCLGSFFFRDTARDVIRKLNDNIFTEGLGDERSLMKMDIEGRYERLNITYNFGQRRIPENYEKADKPLKALHFHPYYQDKRMPEKNIDAFMYGKNEMGVPLMPQRLIDIFQQHGIR